VRRRSWTNNKQQSNPRLPPPPPPHPEQTEVKRKVVDLSSVATLLALDGIKLDEYSPRGKQYQCVKAAGSALLVGLRAAACAGIPSEGHYPSFSRSSGSLLSYGSEALRWLLSCERNIGNGICGESNGILCSSCSVQKRDYIIGGGGGRGCRGAKEIKTTGLKRWLWAMNGVDFRNNIQSFVVMLRQGRSFYLTTYFLFFLDSSVKRSVTVRSSCSPSPACKIYSWLNCLSVFVVIHRS